ncbi:unnamed protein product, partial [Arabidopsis halleri]
MSNLPRDLLEEILSRLPVTSMRAVRSVCKNWNSLSKGQSLTKKQLAQAKAAAAREGEFVVVMVNNYRVYLMSVDLHGIHNNVDPSIKHQGKLVSLTDSDRVDISVVYHCDGLLLCIAENDSRFVVWNPYCGQTRWFEPIRRLRWHIYAIGYENSKACRSYKVLRFGEVSSRDVLYELYYINSISQWEIEFYARGVSLKGNTYWFAQEECEESETGYHDVLLCFDFTKERFGPRISLPFHSRYGDCVTLSSVREEQLAVLFQSWDNLQMEIWITTKIEPEMASWSNKLFLAVDMELSMIIHLELQQGVSLLTRRRKLPWFLIVTKKRRWAASLISLERMDITENLILVNLQKSFLTHLCALMFQVQCKSN